MTLVRQIPLLPFLFVFFPPISFPLLSPSVIVGPLFFLPLSTLPLLSIPRKGDRKGTEGGNKGSKLLPLIYYPCSLPPFPFSPLSFPFPLHSLPLKIVALNTAAGCGKRCKLPQREIKLVHFSLKILHLVAPILLFFLRIDSRSRKLI